MIDEREFRSLKDELDIRGVLAEYCLRLEVNDFEDWLELFTDDTIYEVHRRTLNGKSEVRDMLSKAPPGIHLGGPARIELKDDVAQTIQNYSFLANEEKYSNCGWYYRTLIRTSQGWKISSTKVVMVKRIRSDAAP